MSSSRSVSLLLTGKPTIEGAGVRLQRVFGFPEAPRLDPFLLLDDFGSSRAEDYVAGFPWHPHRGIETVTYLVSGRVEHRDSLGNQGTIGAGDVQWMTAGGGIIHQEMPQPTGEPLRGFQLWVNMPAAIKMSAPRYRDIAAAAIPGVSPRDGVHIKVIAGEVAGARGPVTDGAAQPEYADVSLAPGAEIEHPTQDERTVFAYVVSGSGTVGTGVEQELRSGQLALFGPGPSVRAVAGDSGFRFLLVSGRPLGEPVAWRGPIVMNTGEELATAFREYEQGTFLRHARG
jgi:hypothetical protein